MTWQSIWEKIQRTHGKHVGNTFGGTKSLTSKKKKEVPNLQVQNLTCIFSFFFCLAMGCCVDWTITKEKFKKL